MKQLNPSSAPNIIKLMSKVLLVYDDFAELNATELSLKRVGFDVIGLTNEFTIRDQILVFNPDVLVAYGNTQRVSPASVGKKVKEMPRWAGKSVLIFPKGNSPSAEELIRLKMDLMLESPISVVRLLQIICKIVGQDEKVAIEKLAKTFSNDRMNDTAYASFDEATIQIIKHLQGELDQLEKNKTSNQLDQETPEAAKEASSKKKFFEKEKNETSLKKADPFAQLMNELQGKPNDLPVEKKSTPDELSNQSQLEDINKISGQVKSEIELAVGGLSERVKKYKSFTKDIQLYPESMLKKVKAKDVQKKLKKDWNIEDLESQDEARRKFVDGLFSKHKKE